MQVICWACCTEVPYKHLGGVRWACTGLLYHQGPASILFAIKMPYGPVGIRTERLINNHWLFQQIFQHGQKQKKIVYYDVHYKILIIYHFCYNAQVGFNFLNYLSAAPSPFRVTKAYCLSKEQVLISPYGENNLLSSSWVASKGRFPTNNFTLSPLISVSARHLQTDTIVCWVYEKWKKRKTYFSNWFLKNV